MAALALQKLLTDGYLEIHVIVADEIDALHRARLGYARRVSDAKEADMDQNE